MEIEVFKNNLNIYQEIAQNKNLTVIPEENGVTLFIADGPDNKIKIAKQKVRLSEKRKEIYNFSDKNKRDIKDKIEFNVGMPGYVLMNRITNIICHFPKEGIDSEGNRIGYPYREVDSKGRIKKLRVACCAIGYNALGLMSVQREIEYDIDDILIEYFLSKRKKYPDAAIYRPKGCPPKKGQEVTFMEISWEKRETRYGKKYNHKNEIPKTKKLSSESWVEYPVDENISLFVDYNHPEIVNCYDQLIQIRKKCLALVSTAAQRNSLKHFTGIQTVTAYYDKDTDDWVADLWVTGYKGSLDGETLTDLAERISQGERLSNMEIKIDKAKTPDKVTMDIIETEANDDTDLNKPEEELTSSEYNNQSSIEADELIALKDRCTELFNEAKKIKGLTTKCISSANLPKKNNKVLWEELTKEQIQKFNECLEKGLKP